MGPLHKACPSKISIAESRHKTVFPQGGDIHSMYGKQNVAGGQKEIRRSELYVKLLGLKKKSDKINGNHGP